MSPVRLRSTSAHGMSTSARCCERRSRICRTARTTPEPKSHAEDNSGDDAKDSTANRAVAAPDDRGNTGQNPRGQDHDLQVVRRLAAFAAKYYLSIGRLVPILPPLRSNPESRPRRCSPCVRPGGTHLRRSKTSPAAPPGRRRPGRKVHLLVATSQISCRQIPRPRSALPFRHVFGEDLNPRVTVRRPRCGEPTNPPGRKQQRQARMSPTRDDH